MHLSDFYATILLFWLCSLRPFHVLTSGEGLDPLRPSVISGTEKSVPCISGAAVLRVVFACVHITIKLLLSLSHIDSVEEC